MKRIMKRTLSLMLTLALLLAAVGFLTPVEKSLTVSAAEDPRPPIFAAQTGQNNIIGKTITGYQAWFGRGWYHDWGNSADGRGLFFEQYPSVGDYPAESLWESKFGKLNNGDTAYLFDSTDAGVIDTHMKWMRDNNIDCAAVQRFYGYTTNSASSKFAYLKTIMQKAEKYQRTFYLMYDMSGGNGNTATVVNRIKNDFIYNIEGQGLVSSPAYGHAEGKPVVCLWGLSGVDDNYPKYDIAYQLVTWFKERGYYVIIGTPDNGFTKDTSDYAKVYAAADMISPWHVGRYGMGEVGSSLRNMVINDKAYCDEREIEYLPTIFPGFAWTNLKGVDAYNEISRNGGQFLWRQAVVLAMYGCETVYFAMFDEYDEATSLMKAATDSTMLPVGNSYFLTLAADGYWLSEDYYLRLAGAIGKMLDDVALGKVKPADVITNIPIPFSEGPVYYRNGFTYKVVTITDDAGNSNQVPTRVDPGVGTGPYTFPARGGELIELTTYDKAVDKDGNWVYPFAGESTATEKETGRVHRQISQTYFTLAKDTVLSYKLTAGDANGEKVYLNLMLEDGTLLSQEMISVKDTGAKAGETVTVKVPISNSLAGRRVDGVFISCELNESGTFAAEVDDILIEIGEEGVGDFEAVPAPAEGMLGDVDGDEEITSTDARLTLQYYADKIDEEDLDITVADVDGDEAITSTDARLILQLYAGKIEDFPI